MIKVRLNGSVKSVQDKIGFIKAVRAATNAGLRESKDFVDGVQPLEVSDTEALNKVCQERGLCIMLDGENATPTGSVDFARLVRNVRLLLDNDTISKEYIKGYIDGVVQINNA